MANTTTHLKITAADVAAKLKLEFKDTSDSWHKGFRGECAVDGEPIRFEVYGPRNGSRWYRAPAGEDPISWDRAEIRLNGQRFRRSKARGGDFDWVGIGQAFASMSSYEKRQRALRAERDAYRNINTPSVEALRAEFPKFGDYAIAPVLDRADFVKLSIGVVEVSPAVARIILTALKGVKS